MTPFVDRLISCAMRASKHDPLLREAVERIRPVLYGPRHVTHRVRLDEFPVAQEHRWERDRPYVLEMIHEETGVDATPFMTFDTYCVARAAREWIHTAPIELAGNMVNVVPVSADEIERYNDWPVMLSACGQTEPMSRATWCVRFVRDPMNDRWTGLTLLEIFSVIGSVSKDDDLPESDGHCSVAAARQKEEAPDTDLAMRVLFAETRRQLLLQVFPGTPLREIPYGMVANPDAIIAYQELVLRHLDQTIDPPAHAPERLLREMTTTDATIAQCVGIRLLPDMMRRLLNGP